MNIAVTDTMGREDKFVKYARWITRGPLPVRWERISYSRRPARRVSDYDGVLLTGGGDVDPRLYGGDPDYPGLREVDRRRDDFERRVLDEALSHRVAFLGICRGLQLANVHFGGSLYPDLRSSGFEDHTSDDHRQCSHAISLKTGSSLARMVGASSGVVNSHHHQGVSRVGEGLMEVASSPDRVVEALEFRESKAESFFMLVQWHPERMEDEANPLSTRILLEFLKCVQQNNENRRKE